MIELANTTVQKAHHHQCSAASVRGASVLAMSTLNTATSASVDNPFDGWLGILTVIGCAILLATVAGAFLHVMTYNDHQERRGVGDERTRYMTLLARSLLCSNLLEQGQIRSKKESRKEERRQNRLMNQSWRHDRASRIAYRYGV